MRSPIPVAVGMIIAAVSTAVAAPPSFQGLGSLGQSEWGNGGAQAYGISPDGRTVLGVTDSPEGSVGFRWTSTGGMVQFADPQCWPYAASMDSSVIVGQCGKQAFRWTEAGGVAPIDNPPQGDQRSFAFAASHDGSVIVGLARPDPDAHAHAFRWTAEEGLVRFGASSGAFVLSEAYGVSADGTIVVGSALNDDGFQAFHWTKETGIVLLGDLQSPDFLYSTARAISADGAVIVGDATGDPAIEGNVRQAFRWTHDDGMVGLGPPPSGRGPTVARAVSADGSVVVGDGADSGQRGSAFIWTTELGMMDLRSYLISLGVTGLDGWTLDQVAAISADGRTITGTTTHIVSMGEVWVIRNEPWVAHLGGSTPVCPADWNADGAVNSGDISAFLTAWLGSVSDGSTAADFGGDGVVDSGDISAFLGAWITAVTGGC